jgi:hypothetical protein
MARKTAAQQLQFETAFLGPPQARQETRHSKSGDRANSRRANGALRNRSGGSPELTRAAERPSPTKLLETPGALLTRSHLRALGLERRAVDAVFRALPVVALPGYSRPLIRAEQYLEFVEQHTYRDDRVRPTHA